MNVSSTLRIGARRIALLSATAWVIAAASAVHAVPVPVDDVDSPPPETPAGTGAKPYLEPVCRMVTVRGHVFYNDLRRNGRFSERTYRGGNTAGSAEPWVSTPKPGDNANYLGLLDGTVRLYEHDRASGMACQQTSYVGSAIIDRNGEYSWHGEVCDSCASDSDGVDDRGVSVVAQVSLENCSSPDQRCFSVRDPKGAGEKDHYDDRWDGTVWSRWLRGADLVQPRIVSKENVVDLGDDYFQSERSGAVAAHVDDMPAQAASVFASMVDVTRKVHVEGKVPFEHARYGNIKAFFPSVLGDSTGGAHSHQAGRLCVAAPQVAATYEARDFEEWLAGPRTEKWVGGYDKIGDNDYEPYRPEAWIDGYVVAHEYGHLVHYWTWGGVGKWTSFCYLDKDCEEKSDTQEYALAAFKEGWASFVGRMTYDDEASASNTCASAETESPLGCIRGKSLLCGAGRHYITDVRYALCDLWDRNKDTAKWLSYESDSLHVQARPIEYTDTAQAGIYTFRGALVKMWADATADEKKDVRQASAWDHDHAATAPLGLCRFSQALIGGSISRASVESALAVNGIECNLK